MQVQTRTEIDDGEDGEEQPPVHLELADWQRGEGREEKVQIGRDI